MNETMWLILSLSLSGSILAIIIFILKPFVRHKVPKTIQYYIWLVVLLRLLIPFSFEQSIMNNIFNDRQPQGITAVQKPETAKTGAVNGAAGSSIIPAVRGDMVAGTYDKDPDHWRFINDMVGRYAFYLWVLGAASMLTVNLTGYFLFSRRLKRSSIAATEEQIMSLGLVLKGRGNVRLVRSNFVTTPMLKGIIKPCIVIPDILYEGNTLKNILLHEVSHLRRFDIAVKWLTMLAVSVHWFNPFIYFIRKEIGRVCELACDELVVRNLDQEGKQDYGDTLISVAADNKYPLGVLQVTMGEEKTNLKERLLAIMNHSKKSPLAIMLSVLLLVAAAFGAVTLGANVGNKGTANNGIDVRIDITEYDMGEISKYKTSYVGDHIKVIGIAGNIPAPDMAFRQQYTSMITGSKPYKLTVYYEVKEKDVNGSSWKIDKPDTATNSTLQKNALVVFCMIDNLDEVTFAFRKSQSEGKLEEAEYDVSYTYKRADIEEEYGDLAALGGNLELLGEKLKNN